MPRGVEIIFRVIGEQPRAGFRMFDQLDAECLGDGGGGDIVMRRADATGGKHISMSGAHFVHRFDNVGLDIRHHARLGQAHADGAKFFGDVSKVRIRRAAG